MKIKIDGSFKWNPDDQSNIPLEVNHLDVVSLNKQGPNTLHVRDLTGRWVAVQNGQTVIYNKEAGCIVADDLGLKQIQDDRSTEI